MNILLDTHIALWSRERHAVELESLPLIYTNPFARMLVSRSRAEALVLLTYDTVLSGYGEPVILI
ncbi:MAG: hypothetical protein A2Y38_08720 [Spirochaetes bacterium GWB1_59_5]|nr:MAG: hypothetical protein A2Y38_08720 [Spirochaetes bacterium GWB1_59_5]